MNKKTVLFLIIFLIINISLNAEDPFLIRENTNFRYSNSITLEDGVVSVWGDTKTSVWNLYAQKVDAAGNILWNNGQPMLIDENQGSFPNYIRTVKTNDNCVIIIWIRFFNPDDYRVYAQKINSSGQLLWSANNELILAADFYPHIHLVANDVGGIFIFYNDIQGVIGLNLDSNADDLWFGNINPLWGNVSLRDMKSDNNGGVIINYNDLSGDENLFAARVNSDREILWNEIVTISLPSYYYPKIVAVGSSDFIIWWRWDGNIIGQHFDLAGNRYWGEEGIQINNQPVYEYADIGLFGDNNSFFIAYVIEAPPPSNDEIFKIMKYDLDGNALWEEGTVLSNSSFGYVDLISISNQNYVISWKDNISIYAQKIDSDGNKLWDDEGIVIVPECEFEWTQGGFRINEMYGQLLCTWQPIQDGNSYLKYQALDSNGNLLLPNEGIDIQSGNYSYIDQYQLIGNDASSYCLWEDYRYDKIRIFAQRIAPNGVNYFPTDGIAITDTVFHHQENFRAKALPEGGVIVVWNEVKENETLKRVRWQILNSDGTVNNPNGNDITVNVTLDQTNPQVDMIDGDIIIAWLENESIKAQKLVNYLPIWGNNASLLIEGGNTNFFRIAGSYLYFDYMDNYYFHHIDENGNLSGNWPSAGVGTNTSSYHLEDMIEYNGDLIYTWRVYGDYKIYAFQILSDNGQYIFPDDGFIISEGEDYYYHDFLFDGCINLIHEDETSHNILMERFDLQGNTIWDNVTIQNNHYFNRLKATKLGDNFLVSWCTNFDETTSSYIMRMIDSNGNPIQSNLVYDDFLITSERRDYQIVSATDTDASILFKRGYDVGSETTFFFSGLVSYQVNVSDVPILEDEIASTDNIQLSNYPNPFNPETTISFNVTQTSSFVTIEIYNLKGQKVKTLYFHSEPVEGLWNEFSVAWDAKDDNEKQVSSGVYFYKLKVNGKTKASRKCLLLK